MKLFLVLILFIQLACSNTSSIRTQRNIASEAQSLGYTRLEAITSRYNSLKEFLADRAAVEEYEVEMARYQGHFINGRVSNDFKEHFQLIIDKLQNEVNRVNGLDTRLWELSEINVNQVNINQKALPFSLNQDALQEKFIPNLIKELRKIQQENSFSTSDIDELMLKLDHEYEKVFQLSGKEKGIALARLNQSKEVMWLKATIALDFIESDIAKNLLASQDVDSLFFFKKAFGSIGRYWEQKRNLNLKVLPSFLAFKERTLTSLTQIDTDFERIKSFAEKFKSIKSLSNEPIDIDDANQVKLKIVNEANKSDSLLKLTYMTQAHNDKMILTETANSFKVFNVGRKFHALFRTARFTQCTRNLCTKWLSPIVEGSQSFFTENLSGKNTGYLSLMPAIGDNGMKYTVAELMSSSLAGDKVEENLRDFTIKRINIADEVLNLLDEEFVTSGNGIVVSNGATSNNAGAKNYLFRSNAYKSGEFLADTPGTFKMDLDGISKQIKLDNINNAGPEKFNHDGFNTDGTLLKRLSTKKNPFEFSQRDLEFRYFMNAIDYSNNYGSYEELEQLAKKFSLVQPSEREVDAWKRMNKLPDFIFEEKYLKKLMSNLKLYTKLAAKYHELLPKNSRVAFIQLQKKRSAKIFFYEVINSMNREFQDEIFDHIELRKSFIKNGMFEWILELSLKEDFVSKRNLSNAFNSFLSFLYENNIDRGQLVAVFEELERRKVELNTNQLKRNSFIELIISQYGEESFVKSLSNYSHLKRGRDHCGISFLLHEI